MSQKQKTLADMEVGQEAVVAAITDREISCKLGEMGLFAGEKVQMNNVAPLGDPIAVKVSDIILSLRKAEANHILVRAL